MKLYIRSPSIFSNRVPSWHEAITGWNFKIRVVHKTWQKSFSSCYVFLYFLDTSCSTAVPFLFSVLPMVLSPETPACACRISPLKIAGRSWTHKCVSNFPFAPPRVCLRAQIISSKASLTPQQLVLVLTPLSTWMGTHDTLPSSTT